MTEALCNSELQPKTAALVLESILLFTDQKCFAELSQVCHYTAYHIIILMRSN